MGFKIKLKIDNSKLKNILQKRKDLIKNNITTVVRGEAIPHLIDLIMEGYDRLSDRMRTLPEDPTNPANWRAEFKTKLHEDLERNLIITNKGLTFRLGDKEFLGYNSGGALPNPSDSSPLIWLVFYIEGLLGDWAYITPDIYQQMRGKPLEAAWGRFGKGFMLSRRNFEEEGWDRVVSFEQARHPFSGTSPLDIFTEAVNEFKMKPFIEKAIKASKEGKIL